MKDKHANNQVFNWYVDLEIASLSGGCFESEQHLELWTIVPQASIKHE
jgi:hypothetical protein